jgi:hypothetical protein
VILRLETVGVLFFTYLDRTCLGILFHSWHFAPSSLIGEGTTESEIVQLQHSSALMFNHRSLNWCNSSKKGFCRWASYSTDMGMR